MKSIIIFTAAILPFSSHANVSNGICTKIYEPVLCISDVFWNLCFAELASFDSSANCTLYALRSSLFSVHLPEQAKIAVIFRTSAWLYRSWCWQWQLWTILVLILSNQISVLTPIMSDEAYVLQFMSLLYVPSCPTVGTNEITARLNWRRPIWMRTRNENIEVRSVTLKWEVYHWSEKCCSMKTNSRRQQKNSWRRIAYGKEQ